MAVQEWSESRGELVGKVQIPAVSLVKLLFLEKHFDSCWGLTVSPGVQNQPSSKWWYVKQPPCFCLRFVKLGRVCVCYMCSGFMLVLVPLFLRVFKRQARSETECWTEPFFSHLYCIYMQYVDAPVGGAMACTVHGAVQSWDTVNLW